ncbi:FkbM family methyltransferase [Mesorhizobium sp. B2-1-8]|uniref:FkbM family methyltransferase n=1 Tax=Mesorhizobium sp. B2-1-8 TaxID=2589967 RepID=UPI0015E415EC|nr:FkbM family methyltransferase [Mesorhizobium sp. B2-1-8]UCI19166.1 FkbM family methyltransferase [Mesorhizobium sp. B2-1-8]
MRDQISSAERVFTSHGTTLFVDILSGELRHGSFQNCPSNVVLMRDGAVANLKFVDKSSSRQLVYLATFSSTIDSGKLDSVSNDLSVWSDALSFFALDNNEFALGHDRMFLCAELDGRVTLSRLECNTWERFHTRGHPFEISGTIIRHLLDGQMISFLITDRNDYVQSFLCRGDFYDRSALNLIRKQYDADKIFLDIGANIGNHCVFVSKFCNPRQVIAFEANPDAIAILNINLSLNNCINVNTDYIGLALGAQNGQMRVFYPALDNMGRAQLLPDKQGGIKCIRGDDVVHKQPVGFIKIDVEGAEFEILNGLSKTIEFWRPDILIEVWPQSRQKLEDWCTEFHYVVSDSLPFDNNYFLVPIK